MGQQASSAQDKFPYKPVREVQSSPRISNEFRWSLWDGQDVKDPSKLVSIFCLEPSTNPLAQAMFKRFKTLRHPNILPFLHGITVEEERKTYIVTERIEPLQTRLNDVLTLPESIAWGIHQITKAVHWLNKDFNLVHGNINLSTVYVNKQGDWKLGGLDLVSPIEEVKNGSALVFRFMNLATNIQWSPEMQAPTEKALPALAESPNNAIDSWLIGCLIWTIYNNGSLSSFDRNKLKDMSHIPETLKEDYIKLLTGSPKNRLTLDRLLESPYFGTVFVQTCSFLEHLALKDTFEKEKFFKALPKVLPQFPDAMAKYKILPALTTGLDFGSVDHNALPVVLTIAAKLTPEEYKAQITASVLKWFALPDRTLRICLLQNIDTIIPHLDATQVASIWAPLSQGFTDGAPQLRELTVKSLVQLAPKLGERIINGDMLKFLAQLQVDPVPGIRCNTTVCLGKLANLMTPAVRQKVLLQAFSRALKDPFPPTRKASLAAMSHCHASGFFTPVDIAGKLVPVVAPMALDPELQVRQAALSGLNTYVQYLEQQSAKMPESAPVPGQPGSEAAGDSNAASLAGGMFDWALGKMLGSESTTGPQGKPATNGPASVSSSTTASAAHTTANTHSQSSARPTNSGGSHSASRPTSTSSISMGSSSSSVTPKSKTTPLSTSAAAAPGEVPWGEDDDFPSEPVGRPGTLPTNKQSNPPSHASLTPNSSSSSLGAWGETPHWSSSNSASTTLNSSIGSATGSRLQMQPSSSTPSSTQSDWDDVGDDSFSSPSVRPVATNPASSRGGMSLGGNKATKSTALSAWEDDADGDSGWGQDFTPTATALSRPGKTASHSRFG